MFREEYDGCVVIFLVFLFFHFYGWTYLEKDKMLTYSCFSDFLFLWLDTFREGYESYDDYKRGCRPFPFPFAGAELSLFPFESDV